LRGILWLASNLAVLIPRRTVTIRAEVFPPERRPEPRREALNPWLERYYAADGPEAPTYVPHHVLFGPRTYTFPDRPAGADEIDVSRVPPAVRQAVIALLAEKLGRPLVEEDQAADTSLDALGLDSLDRMELVHAIEQRFGVSGG